MGISHSLGRKRAHGRRPELFAIASFENEALPPENPVLVLSPFVPQHGAPLYMRLPRLTLNYLKDRIKKKKARLIWLVPSLLLV